MNKISKKSAQNLHLILILILNELTKNPIEYEFYNEYYELDISPLDDTKTKNEHLIAIKVLIKIILIKINKLEYFEGIS